MIDVAIKAITTSNNLFTHNEEAAVKGASTLVKIIVSKNVSATGLSVFNNGRSFATAVQFVTARQ